MRPADPVHNVELRRDRHGHESVVLAFPYRADIVDAVRAIPGRRFDWERREWWAPQADATAPYVKGVVERHPGLSVAPDVAAWLAEAATGWVGRVTTARYDGAGWFLLETISGELDEPLAEPAEARAGRLWIPFAQDTADALLELRGARLDPAALRCATRLQVGQAPAPAALTLTEGVGERRFQLEVNWDADTVRPFLELPACEAHGRTLPVDPYLVEPLEAYLRTHGVEVAPAARDALDALRAEHDEAVDAVRRSRAQRGEPLPVEAVLGGELRPFQRAGVAYVLDARRAFCRRAGPWQDGAGARRPRGRRRLPRRRRLSREPQAHVGVGSRAVAAAPHADRHLGYRRRAPSGRHHGPQLRDRPRPPRPSGPCTPACARPRRVPLRQEPAGEAHRGAAAPRRHAPPGGLRLALTGTPVINHAEELISQLRVIGRLEDFGSGARFARRFQGIGAEERIHWHLRRRCFVRRLKSDVLPQLPAKRQVAVPVAIDNEREYRLAERDVIAWLREQPLDLRELDRKVAAALRAERLAQLNALKRLAALGKCGAALGWIEDFLASDERLVVFASSREVQELVLRRFPGALHLLGRDDAAARDAAVRAFQAEDGPPLLVCSVRVAGQGITLTRASNVAFLDLSGARRRTTRRRTAATASASATPSPPGTCSPRARSTRP